MNSLLQSSHLAHSDPSRCAWAVAANALMIWECYNSFKPAGRDADRSVSTGKGGCGGPFFVSEGGYRKCAQPKIARADEYFFDGRRSLIFTNQHGPGGTTIFHIPLPDDPYITPWPGIEVIAAGVSEPNPFRQSGMQPEEGLALGDIDGDGKNELVCGTH